MPGNQNLAKLRMQVGFSHLSLSQLEFFLELLIIQLQLLNLFALMTLGGSFDHTLDLFHVALFQQGKVEQKTAVIKVIDIMKLFDPLN